MSTPSSDLAAALHAGDRRALAKAITLLESRRDADAAQARDLLDRLLPLSGRSVRIGISGAPGVGKSTLIESLGLELIARGHRLAVLAIDPSSTLSRGSILGDKTRMDRLSVHPDAFIRPSPSSGTLGGLAAHTREVISLCEAAGFDRIIVETVGVGQSESAVADVTDTLLLMHLPNAGDELQALKKGVHELADIFVVNKADLDDNAAASTAHQLQDALRMRPGHSAWVPPVLIISATTGRGLDQLVAGIERHHAAACGSSRFEERRCAQNLAWMRQMIDEGLAQRFRAATAIDDRYDAIASQVDKGELSALAAAARLLALFDSRKV